jgi:hypothetical protein
MSINQTSTHYKTSNPTCQYSFHPEAEASRHSSTWPIKPNEIIMASLNYRQALCPLHLWPLACGRPPKPIPAYLLLRLTVLDRRPNLILGRKSSAPGQIPPTTPRRSATPLPSSPPGTMFCLLHSMLMMSEQDGSWQRLRVELRRLQVRLCTPLPLSIRRAPPRRHLRRRKLADPRPSYRHQPCHVAAADLHPTTMSADRRTHAAPLPARSHPSLHALTAAQPHAPALTSPAPPALVAANVGVTSI